MEENTTNEVSDYVVEVVDEESETNSTESESYNSETGDSDQQSSFDNTSAETGSSTDGTEELKKSEDEENDKLLNSLRKLLSEQNEEQSEVVFDEVSGGQTNDDQVEVPEEVEEGSIDYTLTLNAILDELEEVNSNYESLQTYLEETNDNNSMNSTLSTQSATNVLLCIAIIVALIDLVYHFAKGVL